MGNSKVLVDTSVIIDFLRKKEKDKTLFWEIINQYDCYISTITEFELFCGAITLAKTDELNKLLSFLIVSELNSDIARKASEFFLQLKGKNKIIEFRDIFISATAVILEIPLVTLNTKHFNRIPSLKLL